VVEAEIDTAVVEALADFVLELLQPIQHIL
jgi:hypothetical protein